MASISRLIWTLSPTTAPPPSMGRLVLMPNVLAIDLRRRGEAGAGAAIGVFREAVEVERQVHALGHAVEREVALHNAPVAGWPDAQ